MKPLFQSHLFEELADDLGSDIRECEYLKFKEARVKPEPFRVPLFKKSYVKVYWVPNGRLLIYGPNDRLLIRKIEQTWFLEFDMISEIIAYRVLRDFYISLSGLLSESAGEMRIHAAGIVAEGGVDLYWGRSGSGKSTLAAGALISGQSIISDEVLLYDGRKIRGTGLALSVKQDSPFYKREDFKKKRFMPERSYKKLVRQIEMPLKRIFILNRSAQMRPTYFLRLKMYFYMFIGDGLYQMTEYHLAWCNLKLWLRVLRTRTVLLLKIMRTPTETAGP